MFNNFTFIFYITCTLFFCKCTLFHEINNRNIRSKEQTLNKVKDTLDFGLYWFNTLNKSQSGFDISSNTNLNVSLNYYDDQKPTIIYFHGSQKNSCTNNYFREDFTFNNINGDVINTAKIWKNRGWNVGIFYWNQFADEDYIVNAETKIWTNTSEVQMRYRLSDSSYSKKHMPNKSVGKIAFEQIVKCLKNNTSNNIRFVGHSIGAQLACYTACLLYTSDAADD